MDKSRTEVRRLAETYEDTMRAGPQQVTAAGAAADAASAEAARLSARLDLSEQRCSSLSAELAVGEGERSRSEEQLRTLSRAVEELETERRELMSELRKEASADAGGGSATASDLHDCRERLRRREAEHKSLLNINEALLHKCEHLSAKRTASRRREKELVAALRDIQAQAGPLMALQTLGEGGSDCSSVAR